MAACNSCGRDNPSGAAYCVHCGAVLTALVDAATSRIEVGADLQTRTSAVLLESLRSATLGEYEILGELGRGGMAVVYLAHDIALDRKVAIKVISPNVIWASEGVSERFKREARTAASLSHPHIIPIYAVREIDDLLFFVMKYVKGRTLESVISEIGALPPGMVHTILTQVGSALGYAHRQGVVHRDIKPGNIMLDEEGWAVVTDFGIAKVAAAEGLTQTGGTVGTPAYMSPEQCSGLPVTGASDQYSLGIVAYEMLSGRKPFEAKSAMALMYKHCNQPPLAIQEAVHDCPYGIATAVMRMLEKAPDHRWPSLEDMVSMLGSVPAADTDRVRTQMLTLAKGSDAQALLSKFQTPSSPVPKDRLSDSIALATRSREAKGTKATPPGDVTPLPAIRPGGTRKIIWAIPSVAAAAIVLVLWAPWKRDAPPTQPQAPARDSVPSLAAPTVASVEVTPELASLSVGETIRLSATARSAQGGALPAGDLTWQSSDPAVAIVSASGLVQALAAGQARIRAASQGVTASSVISVSEPEASPPPPTRRPPVALRVASVRVTPGSATLAVDETVQLEAQPRDQNGAPIARGVTWTSSAENVAVVTAQGLVLARGEGSARITASSDGRSASITVTVAPVAVASVTVSPARASLGVGETVRLTAALRDAGGNVLSGRPVTWSSSAADVVRVSGDGTVTGTGTGSAVVTAQSGAARASAQVTVEAPPARPDVAAARSEIEELVQAYGRAIQNRDLAALKRLYPDMSARQENSWATFFANVRELRVTISLTSVELDGDAATARATMALDFRNGGRNQQTDQLRLALARRGGVWRIATVQ